MGNVNRIFGNVFDSDCLNGYLVQSSHQAFISFFGIARTTHRLIIGYIVLSALGFWYNMVDGHQYTVTVIQIEMRFS